MKSKVSNPLSEYRKNRRFSQTRQNNNLPEKVNININQLTEIYNYLYEDIFPSILCLSKTSFFEKINKQVKESISHTNYEELQSSSFLKQITKIKEEITKKYDNDYKILSTEYQNFLKNGKNYNYLVHFRKHCPQTDNFALHNCSTKKKGKFIEIIIKNRINNKEEISYVICSECKYCYVSNFIMMFCSSCNKNYFSNILGENENINILPATWEKYHCGPIINEIMKCVKCRCILYLNLNTKELVCKNKKCNFVSKPESIIWKCSNCSADFRSSAKIYNPLEFQILKRAINIAILLKKKARPKQLPCGCEKDISKLTFFHKEECLGELYIGMLIDKEIIVCNKCHAINFEEKYTWICPKCSTKFHLHNMIGCRPFSKKKYIINRQFNQSVKYISKRNKNKDNKENNKEKNMNNINIYIKKESDSINDSNAKHKKNLKSFDMKRIQYGSQIGQNLNRKEDNEIDTIFNKKKTLMNKKKTQNYSNTADKIKKQYSTLLEILQERKRSQPKKVSKLEVKEKDSETNDSQNYNSSQRSFKNNIINRNRKDYLNYKNRTGDNYYNLYKNENLHKFLEDKIKGNKNLDNNLTTGLTALTNNNDSPIKENDIKKIKVNKRFNFKMSSFNTDESNNENNKQKEIAKGYESTDLSTFKSLSSNDHKTKNSLFYSISSANRISNPFNIFRIQNKKTYMNNDNSKGFDVLRSSKLTNQLTENSYQDMNNDLRFSSILKMDTFNSSYRISCFNSTTNEMKDANKKYYNNFNEISQDIPEIKVKGKLVFDMSKDEEILENLEEKEKKDDNQETKILEKIEKDIENAIIEKNISKNHSKYEDDEEENDNSENNDEIVDKFKEIPFNASKSKKNVRESFAFISELSSQNVLISQEKLNTLANNTNIPSFKETDYNFLKPIGEGTYGIVYLAEKNDTYEQFAIKKIICRDYHELIKHKNELELIYSVKHENILKLCGIQFKYLDITTSAIYVLMELAQNDWNMEIKRRILAKKYYKENEIILLLKQIIKGFLFLQEKNIAHRDIKPQNILLFPNNIYKIADFGEAKNIKNITQQYTLRGSELYMSPILYKGYKFNQKNIMHNPYKSDVFSLGYCLLYAICLNLKVLESIRELTTIRSVISSVNKYIMKNKYSDKLMNIIYKMIEPNEDDRFDFEDLSIELDKDFK